MRYWIVFCFMLIACSTLDQDTFFRKATGAYTLNKTGIGFFRREANITLIEDTVIEFRGDGSLVAIINSTTTEDLAFFVELKQEKQGIFRLANTNTFIAMGYLDKLWITTTNTYVNQKDVLFENLAPIARKNN